MNLYASFLTSQIGGDESPLSARSEDGAPSQKRDIKRAIDMALALDKE